MLFRGRLNVIHFNRSLFIDEPDSWRSVKAKCFYDCVAEGQMRSKIACIVYEEIVLFSAGSLNYIGIENADDDTFRTDNENKKNKAKWNKEKNASRTIDGYQTT